MAASGKSSSSSKSSSTKKTGSSKKASPARKASPAERTPKATESSERTEAEYQLVEAAKGVRADFLKELIEIAKDLDEVSLGVLKQQAAMLRARGKLQDFSATMNEAAEEVDRRRREASRPAFEVVVEQRDNDYFIIQLDDARIFFTLAEMRVLTGIAHKGTSPADGARRLYRWLHAERRDLLNDAGINEEQSPYLRNLWQEIVTTYRVRGS